MKEHRLWQGFWSYGWVSKVLLGIALVLGVKFLMVFLRWFQKADMSHPLDAVVSMGTMFQSFAFDSFDFLFYGGMKYIMLILLEVLVFHFCRRTLAVLSGNDSDLTFDAFVKAQIRMIKVVIRAYIMEMILTALIKLFFNIFGVFEFLQPVLIFGVQCYYLGFVVLDNYHEQFELTITESAKYARQFVGVALGVGLITNVMLMIPAVGPIVGPILAAVTVTLVMYELSDLHILGKTVVEPLDDIV